MLAGKMKLSQFLAIAGVGLAASAGGLGWWLGSQTPEPAPFTPQAAVETPTTPAKTPVATPPAATAPPAATPTASPITTLMANNATQGPAHQADVMRWVGKDLGSSKKKDATQGKAWKVNVYQDDGNSTANRAKVDLDRDDKWDEKWTFDADGAISRKIAPADDENYTLTQVWNGASWATQ